LTHNNCESVHHTLKQRGNWKSKLSLDFIYDMNEMVGAQCQGPWMTFVSTRLADSHRHILTSLTAWPFKTNAECEKMQSFMPIHPNG